MGRKATKYHQARKKLSWFFEQISCDDLHGLPIDPDIRSADMRKRQWSMFGRKSEVAKIRWVLGVMATPAGLIAEGRPLRLTPKMLAHVVAELTDRNNAVELLHGKAENKKKARYNADCYRQTLNKSLARIEAAFFHVGIFPARPRRIRQVDGYVRNEHGYLVD